MIASRGASVIRLEFHAGVDRDPGFRRERNARRVRGRLRVGMGVELCEEHGLEPHLAHPSRLKGALIRDSRHDLPVRILRACFGRWPISWCPDSLVC